MANQEARPAGRRTGDARGEGQTEERRGARAHGSGQAPDVMRDIQLPCMEDLGMRPVAADEPTAALLPKRAGVYYRFPRDTASGYYWTFADGDFAVSVTDMTLKRDFRERCRHPRFVGVRYFESVRAEEFVTGKRYEGPFLEGHVVRSERWDALWHAEVPARSVEIMLAPAFYERYLRDEYADEGLDAEAAFASIDGIAQFPELIVALKQIEAYRGQGASARLYYRGKVNEAVALIVEKSRELAVARANGAEAGDGGGADGAAAGESASCARALGRVIEYLDAHAREGADAETLARIACMGQTKLRAEFKRAFGCTITGYLQHRRLADASRLLAESDMPLAQVAAAVGYRTPERFKELFEREMGCSPAAYRKALAPRAR